MGSDGSEFPMKRLADVGVQLLDCEHKTPKPAGAGFPYVAIPNVRDGRLDLSDVRRITASDYREWTKKTKPQAGDVIVTRRARVGDTAVVPEGLECAIGQNLVILRSNGVHVDQQYLRWVLRGPLYRRQVDKFMNVGAVFDSLNCADIPKFEIPVPPLPEQRAIAHVLGTLDDKIENNRRMNATLEAMARALFKSWFVDFDPVRAKAEGRQPAGMDAETAALFPDGFQDSPLGKVPRGWGAGKMADIVELIGGGTPKTAVPEYWDGDIPWFSVVDAPTTNDVWVVTTEKTITVAGLENSSARVLDVGTSIISARGTVGKVALVGTPMAMNQSCYGVRGNVEGSDIFTYFMLRNEVTDLQQHSHGSVFSTITRHTFDGLDTVIPPPGVRIAYDGCVSPFLEKMRHNLWENCRLAALRDALLPRLISGEVRVGEAEALAGEAV